jgi:hypothetical protein
MDFIGKILERILAMSCCFIQVEAVTGASKIWRPEWLAVAWEPHSYKWSPALTMHSLYVR